MCNISLTLLLVIYCVVREVKMVCNEDGLTLIRSNGKGEWRVNVLLFVDGTVLLGETKGSLQRLVLVFNKESRKSGLRINGEKSKVMRMVEDGRQLNLRVRVG